MTAALQIMLLDDEYDSVTEHLHGLKRAGHVVHYARDLRQALEVLEEIQLDWVFIDLMLDCSIPMKLAPFYALLSNDKYNEGQALGMFLWQHKGQKKSDGSAWPGYAYLTNGPTQIAKATNPAQQEFGNSLNSFLLSKFEVAGDDIKTCLAGRSLEWKKL